MTALCSAGAPLRILLEAPESNDACASPSYQRGRYPHAIERISLDQGGLIARVPELGSDDLLMLVEDGCEPPAEFAKRLLAHLASAGGQARAVAASTNSAPGEARVDAAGLGERVENARDQYSNLAQRWPGAHEDLHALGSPVVLLADPAALRAGLRAHCEHSTALELPSEGRLLLARDVAVWRGPDLAPEALFEVRVRALERSPAGPDLSWRSLADLHARERSLRRAIESQAHPLAYLELAELYALIGDYERGGACARACLNLWPRHVDAQLCAAEHSSHEGLAGSGARTRTHLQAILDQGPLSGRRRARLFACLGESWRRKGDSGQAQQCFESSLALQGEQELAQNGLARIELESGEFDVAVARLLGSARRVPLRAETWSNLGRALAMAGNNLGARSMLARSLSINPNGREARQLMGRLSACAGGSEHDESTRQAIELLGQLGVH